MAEKFLTDYVHLKQLRAGARYEMAIRTHIIGGVGRVVADMLTRDQVRSLMKEVMVQVPSTRQGKSRRRGGIEAARSVVAVLRKMINWSIRERLLKRTDNPVSGMEDNLPRKRRKERVLSLEERLLAAFYIASIGVEQNYAEAARLYKLAADAGDPSGHYSYAWCYSQGVGVEKSQELAFPHWLKAAGAGIADAQFAVAECLFTGRAWTWT